MNIKQVKYFISVADSGSLSAAAREHDVSVQAMSKAMFDLEEAVGETLFIRTHQGAALTPLGMEFYDKALHVYEEFLELEHFANTVKEGNSHIAAMLCAPAFQHNKRARANIAAFIRSHLNIDADIRIGSGEEGLELLENGDVDALITIGAFDREGFDCVSAGTVPAGICMAQNHPLAKHSSVTIEEIAAYPVFFSETFDRFNESILITYQKEYGPFNLASPDRHNPGDAIKIFYFDHAVCFMAFISALGEMLPFSTTIPIASEDQIPVPLCFVTLSKKKSAAYLKTEQLFLHKQ